MKFKKTFTITVDQALAERIEELKEEGNKSYTELFIEGIKMLLEIK